MLTAVRTVSFAGVPIRLRMISLKLYSSKPIRCRNYVLSVLGKCEVRLPLVPVAETTRRAVRDAVVHAGLIN